MRSRLRHEIHNFVYAVEGRYQVLFDAWATNSSNRESNSFRIGD